MTLRSAEVKIGSLIFVKTKTLIWAIPHAFLRHQRLIWANFHQNWPIFHGWADFKRLKHVKRWSDQATFGIKIFVKTGATILAI